jgi:L,D-peptidoglycan transpeptidase YkuD (ErfK/YbiS/YcfS/YnhG family)
MEASCVSVNRRYAITAGCAAVASMASGKFLRAESQKSGVGRGSANVIKVSAKPGATSGTLNFAEKTYPCLVGRAGIVRPKFEGDGGTPAGTFPLREVRYRPDRISTPASGLPVFKSSRTDGWCDDPEDPSYNRIVSLPHQTDAELMWRDDHLYDVLAVVGYNDAPTVPGAGSAIFLHVSPSRTDAHQYTAGCVSVLIQDLLEVLASCTPSTTIDISTA